MQARISIQHTAAVMMSKHELEDHVFKSLLDELTNEVYKHMTINSQYDAMTDTTTYIASMKPQPGAVGASGTLRYSGTISNTNVQSLASVQKIFRVVEYTKGGKVSRVELQSYCESDDSWIKIPRIQIEEN
jgi:hypothetical protein